MFDATTTLAMLQFGDSAYPAGGFAFSWGVEGLAADDLLTTTADLDGLAQEHLALRWNSMDRVLLRRAYAADTVTDLLAIDGETEALTASAQMRDGSRRAGRALLGISARSGGALSGQYRAAISTDARLGHMPVAQGVVYRDARFDLAAAELLSGWTLVTGLVSAAVRLGVIGYVEAQHSLGAARRTLGGLLLQVPEADALPSSFTPIIDIAVSRGPARHVRMFAT